MKSTITIFGQWFLAVLVCLSTSVVGRAAEVMVRGISKPILDVILSAPAGGTVSTTGGVVSSIHVSEGDKISKNQVLIELEKRQEELGVERGQLILDDKSELAAAEQKVHTLKADLDSTRKLFEATGSISKEALAAKELEYKVAVAERDRLEVAEKSQDVELRLAKELLQQKTIRSPLNGRVVRLFKQVGEGCRSQDPLIRVVDISSFHFEANLEAKLGSLLKLNETVEIVFGSSERQKRIQGRLVFVSPVVDPSSGLLRVKILCENKNEHIKPGMDGSLILKTP
ncbi:efflux RND transporter periplasmic adaptor subunit [bacterium]|nr:efflux RND transporter periplasmic adaptor subunit [bacterium]